MTGFDSYLEPPFDPREPFFENVIGLVPESDLSDEEYEKNEKWFIDLVDKLYDMYPIADPQIVSNFVQECWKHKQAMDQEDQYLIDDYPEFTTNY